MHSVNLSGSELQKYFKFICEEYMTTALKDKPEIAQKCKFALIPIYSVADTCLRQ